MEGTVCKQRAPSATGGADEAMRNIRRGGGAEQMWDNSSGHKGQGDCRCTLGVIRKNRVEGGRNGGVCSRWEVTLLPGWVGQDNHLPTEEGRETGEGRSGKVADGLEQSYWKDARKRCSDD